MIAKKSQRGGQLQGRTLEVYWWLLTQKEPQTARQIKEGVGLSSVSLAKYHLQKLCELELVDECGLNEFCVIREKLFGELRFYIYLRRRLVPRFVFYASFYTAILLLSAIFLFPYLSLGTIIFILVLIVFSLGSSLYETFVLVHGTPLKR